MSALIGSRDLSGHFSGELTVTVIYPPISGRASDTQTTTVEFSEAVPLSRYVWQADYKLHQWSTPILEPSAAPWTIVDFDGESRKLTVRHTPKS